MKKASLVLIAVAIGYLFEKTLRSIGEENLDSCDSYQSPMIWIVNCPLWHPSSWPPYVFTVFIAMVTLILINFYYIKVRGNSIFKFSKKKALIAIFVLIVLYFISLIISDILWQMSTNLV